MTTTTTDSVAGFPPRAGRGARRTLPPGSAGRATLVSPDARVAPSTSPAARPPLPPRAAGDPLDREVGPVPAGRPSLPGSLCLEPGESGIKPPPPGPRECSRDGGGTPLARGRVSNPAGGAVDADAVLSVGSKAIAAAMSEDRGPDSLEAHLRKLMKDLGLTGFHVEKSLDVDKNRKNVSVKGWPDWTIRGPKGVLFRELKSQQGRVEPEQREWLDALAADGADVDVWRPVDLLTGRIQRELTEISRLAGAVA